MPPIVKTQIFENYVFFAIANGTHIIYGKYQGEDPEARKFEVKKLSRRELIILTYPEKLQKKNISTAKIYP